ncbi:FAD-dependent oxidoreductase [Arthrobacter sp. H20]|uniref:dihydrolipoyl dehydrogenase family protein n=1 Tax=Arthrobacter sp. H20 TaxID=1267981 RepID=UPI0004BBC247|nr:FAD-dependent oxidoreductase [Arthrobacter sp. H20]
MEQSSEVYDLLVIGGGTAGLVGAKTAARLGGHTVLVESSRTGGDCLWTGCVPSKTLLSAAKAARQGGTERDATFAAIRNRISAAIRTIEPADSAESLEKVGVTVLSGAARFTGQGVAEVNGKKVRFRRALIATGSAPALPDIPGLAEAPAVVTSETVWDLPHLPERLVIIGGGPIACELGQAFARLGSSVVILARSEILPKEDRDAVAHVRDSLLDDGVKVVENSGAARVSTGDATVVHTTDGQTFDADVILVAAGRKARTEGIGLDSVGVHCDPSGYVAVNSAMRTSNPTIWAAGDVTPYPDFTHLAGVHASTAASNAILGLRRSVSTVRPRVTFTSPEVAAVGVTEATATEHSVSTIQHSDSDRAIAEGRTAGFTRIIVGKGGRILGGTIVGPRAGESLAELTLAVHQGLSTRTLASVTHPYPTHNDSLWNAAVAHARTGLESPVAKVAVRALAGINRWRGDRMKHLRNAD